MFGSWSFQKNLKHSFDSIPHQAHNSLERGVHHSIAAEPLHLPVEKVLR
jgi:hypothetical protein